MTVWSLALHISFLRKGLRPIMHKSIKFLFCWVVLQHKRVCLSVCMSCRTSSYVCRIHKNHNQSLISHLLYNVINNFVGRHTPLEPWQMDQHTSTEISFLVSLCPPPCVLKHLVVCFSVIPGVSQMLSPHLKQMVADSNGAGLCKGHLSVHLQHTWVRLIRYTTQYDAKACQNKSYFHEISKCSNYYL